MTRENAEKFFDNMFRACLMAKHALQVEPCDDAISRKTISDYLFEKKYYGQQLIGIEELLEYIEDMPDVFKSDGEESNDV